LEVNIWVEKPTITPPTYGGKTDTKSQRAGRCAIFCGIGEGENSAKSSRRKKNALAEETLTPHTTEAQSWGIESGQGGTVGGHILSINKEGTGKREGELRTSGIRTSWEVGKRSLDASKPG